MNETWQAYVDQSQQWIGFLLILGGYLYYDAQKFWSSFASFLGGMLLAAWAVEHGAWGIMALQATWMLISVYKMWRFM